MLTALAIANYRSFRDFVTPLKKINIVSGPNGSGKSSLYRAIRLLAETARGNLIASIAKEGGLPSALWAGPEKRARSDIIQRTPRSKSVNLQMGFTTEEFGFLIDLGLPR